MKFSKIRRWSRVIHRDLSFFFSGMLIIYAVSGIAMNHVKTSNPNYTVERHEYSIKLPIVAESTITKEYVVEKYLNDIDQAKNYTKHYFPEPRTMKVFLKGGANIVVNLDTNTVLYEEVKPRHVMRAMARLHYNPGKWWTLFSDIFAVSMVVIILTGLVMVKGKRGMWGIGGIEFLIGVAIPLLFIFFF